MFTENKVGTSCVWCREVLLKIDRERESIVCSITAPLLVNHLVK